MHIFCTAAAVLALCCSARGAAPQITGAYLEARSCDVFTGPCFANSEVGLTGELATMAWSVKSGARNGVDLSGLTVVAVVKADRTLTDQAAEPAAAKALVIVDAKASAQQRIELVGLAKDMAGKLLADIVRVDATDIEFTDNACAKSGCARLVAGNLLRIETRCMNKDDHKCGNEYLYYPPLTAVERPLAAMASAHDFQGRGLNVTWKLADKRSAFIGTFAK